VPGTYHPTLPARLVDELPLVLPDDVEKNVRVGDHHGLVLSLSKLAQASSGKELATSAAVTYLPLPGGA
jgi:hypothetical protein